MEATYFRDESETDIDKIVVIESYDDGYWLTENREDGWCKPFYMPEQEFHATEIGEIPPIGFEKIMEAAE